MKFNNAVLGLAMALIVTPSWGHGEHGSNTVWKTADGHAVLSTNGECVRATDFASLGRNSCHAPEVIEAPVVAAPEAAVVVEMVEKLEPAAAAKVILSVENHETSIRFNTDSAALSMDATQALNKSIAHAQGAEHVLAVQIVGHADTTGDENYNLNLSQRRVDAVVDYLAARGLKTSSRFAQGEANPIIENGKENLAASRRAELLIKVQVKTMN
jgi:outer membrane protein OmpA-like peptidoglycan-associated protein